MADLILKVPLLAFALLLMQAQQQLRLQQRIVQVEVLVVLGACPNLLSVYWPWVSARNLEAEAVLSLSKCQCTDLTIAKAE